MALGDISEAHQRQKIIFSIKISDLFGFISLSSKNKFVLYQNRVIIKLSHSCTLFAKLFNIYLPHPLILDFTSFQVFPKLLLEITCTVFFTACSQQNTLCLILLHWIQYKYTF